MIDVNLVFDGTPPNTGVAITTTAASTNVLDMLSARDIGVGDDLELHVQVLETFTAGGAATLQIAFQGCATAGGTYKDLMLSPVLAVADLVVGAKVFQYVVPKNQLNNTSAVPYEFYRLNYTVATGPFTAGKVFSYMTGGGDRPALTIYGPNYTNNG